ncbi:Exopolyphosphatase [compost metagenome]
MNVAHYYKIEGTSLHHYEELLPHLSLEKRKSLDGLSKSRADIIVPGIIILNTIYKYIHADCYIVSGTGLREGLLFEAEHITLPDAGEVVHFQVKNILAFDNASSIKHLKHVHHVARSLYEAIASSSNDSHNSDSDHTLLYAAAMLYQVGMNVRYHQYDKHTFYWLTHVPMIGMDHHKTLICACIASGMTPNKKVLLPYKSLLHVDDLVQIERLGVLLQLAIALDVSVTQSLEFLRAIRSGDALCLHLKAHKEAPLELRELEGLHKNFKKAWGLNLQVQLDTSSMI